MATTSVKPSPKVPSATDRQRDIYRALGVKIPKKLALTDAAAAIDSWRNSSDNRIVITEIEKNGLSTFSELLKDITIEHIHDRFVRVRENWKTDSYIKSYEHFVQYFQSRPDVELHDLIIGANFSYAWMPNTLKFKSTNFDHCVQILRRAKNESRLTATDILPLVRLIDNSIVGASKLLHFVNPSVYAIWDSRVCCFISARSSRNYYNDVDNYMAYLKKCTSLSCDPCFQEIYDGIQEITGYKISRMRVIEQIMFLNSDKPIVADILRDGTLS